MKHRFNLVLILAILIAVLPQAVFAKVPREVGMSIRNLTKQTVQLAYRGADGVQHWAQVPAGLSTLSLPEGVVNYWADPACGHIAGSLNVNNSNKVLWLECSASSGAGIAFSKNNQIGATCPDKGFYGDFNSGGDPIYAFFSSTHWNDGFHTFQEIADSFPAGSQSFYGCVTRLQLNWYMTHW